MTIATGQDTLKTRRSLEAAGQRFDYFSLKAAEEAGLGDLSRLPFSLKLLLENLLRFEDGRTVSVADVTAVAQWLVDRRSDREIAYRPARVLMQDFTGVPAVCDLAAMREAMVALGGDPTRINPLVPVDLVIDHSVMVDYFASADAFAKNVAFEFERNLERYAFLRWGQTAFDNFRVVPPGTGICHQVNIEHLAQVVWTDADPSGHRVAYPDTLVGTDSHTTMVNGLAVLGWGVGGIEAEAAMLGQPISMLIPEVVGFKLTGRMKEGNTATDLVLTVTQMLREKGVVGKFVEFFGPGLDGLSLPDRATIANMAPEYGATCGIFPIDAETIRYLTFTGRDADRVALVEAYAKAQGMWRDADSPDPFFTEVMELDMATVEPSLAGPRRPQDRVALSNMASSFAAELTGSFKAAEPNKAVPVTGGDFSLEHGAVVIAAITSCTNTSNPAVLVAAGLVAKKAVEKGLRQKPWVKTSLAPGSQVVSDYLAKAGLQPYLDQLGFNVVGYGCTTCIGNSGPLPDAVAAAVEGGDLVVAAVLSGNRNFEGRVNPHTRANYLASPPLCVAYALAGNLRVDLTRDALGVGADGQPVYLKDIWPTDQEIQAVIGASLTAAMFRDRYSNVFQGPEAWRSIATAQGRTYRWQDSSTYVKRPPFFDGLTATPDPVSDVRGARALAVFGDSITTDHISPAGSIKTTSPAGAYLIGHQVRPQDFNSYGARRGNHEVMMRGTFANIRIRNELLPGVEGGETRHYPSGERLPIHTAAMRYAEEGVPLVIVAGKEYGTGSSRDWAAKGTRLLGVKAVIAESFERIHRSNLVGMGILPLQFMDGLTRADLRLDGSERFDIAGVEEGLRPRKDMILTLTRADGARENHSLLLRIDTADEVDYYRNGGVLNAVLRSLAR
ncbi:aconitate hydratase AcnA [Azospirillum sp.]|uniref:aconitate hydratase AcnA n=1 Tax=Azospirillum sp. TaxID=34012 RepID=UPI00263958E5|nr:aconitate hydratase AcnA [Azospirillum sp.]